MKTSTLSQAREGVHSAVRMVSVRAALPFFGTGSLQNWTTYIGIALILGVILYLIRNEFLKFRKDDEYTEEELSQERNMLEERLATRTKEYIRAESERLAELERNARFGELSKGLFHDLMNPLATISMYVEKLKQSNEEREIVNKVVTISKRMNSFMESVRHSIGTSATSQGWANLTEELGIIRDIFGYKAKTSEVTLEIQECPNISLPIHPIRLHQLISNIVSNAIDACIEDREILRVEKEYTVSVKTALYDYDIEIIISDNGRGMTEEKRRSLFQKPESTKPSGLGIGLSTVHTILNELGGSVSVSSDIKNGSIFTIRIPHNKKEEI